ncbi:hypothetical protein N3Z32_10020 [Achromobacter sp. SS2-2022]|uniref:hypothetical protein n=1 Tax=Achromobacter sp. SS2-2022 TaxID=2980498 RepID=UPI0024069EF5|nr:hypothetical protein [Achromobacter sp. SS2-2022]WEX96457.1 hypothetical protein N3Z32_10020 [Achromobacter sp. SS2-2022]
MQAAAASPATFPPPALLATIGALTFIDFLQNGMVTFAATPIMGEIGASPRNTPPSPSSTPAWRW